MRKVTVVIKNATGPETRYVLGWDERRMWIKGWRLTPESLVQVQEYARSETVNIYDRGNVRHTLVFMARYEMESIVKADVEALDIRSRIPRKGDVEIETHAAFERQVRWLRNAVIQIGEPSVMGISISVPYTILGGTITK